MRKFNLNTEGKLTIRLTPSENFRFIDILTSGLWCQPTDTLDITDIWSTKKGCTFRIKITPGQSSITLQSISNGGMSQVSDKVWVLSDDIEIINCEILNKH